MNSSGQPRELLARRTDAIAAIELKERTYTQLNYRFHELDDQIGVSHLAVAILTARCVSRSMHTSSVCWTSWK
jgi:hypothetical protein